MNLIPEGALHARKHNLEKVNSELDGQITSKGIPVVAQSEGGIVQTAEIEKEEWTLRKEELTSGAITRDEYFEWKINWPQTCDDCGKREPSKQWRKSSE